MGYDHRGVELLRGCYGNYVKVMGFWAGWILDGAKIGEDFVKIGRRHGDGGVSYRAGPGLRKTKARCTSSALAGTDLYHPGSRRSASPAGRRRLECNWCGRRYDGGRLDGP